MVFMPGPTEQVAFLCFFCECHVVSKQVRKRHELAFASDRRDCFFAHNIRAV